MHKLCKNHLDLLRATDGGSRHTWAPGCHSQRLQHRGIAGRRNLGVVHLVGRVHAVRRQRLSGKRRAHAPLLAEVHSRRVRVAAPAGRVDVVLDVALQLARARVEARVPVKEALDGDDGEDAVHEADFKNDPK